MYYDYPHASYLMGVGWLHVGIYQLLQYCSRKSTHTLGNL